MKPSQRRCEACEAPTDEDHGTGSEVRCAKCKDIPAFFEWTIKVRVHQRWVADGLDLTSDETVQEALLRAFGWLTHSELLARCVKAPDPALIRKHQGFPPL